MRSYIISFVCLCATINCYAQFSIGAKAGLAISNFDNAYRTKAHVGYKAGLSAQYMFSDWGIQTGLYLTELGIADSKGYLPAKDNSQPLPASMEVSPRYIEIPLSVIYKFPIAENLKIGINTGAYLGIGYSGSGIVGLDGLQHSFGIDAFDDAVTNTDYLASTTLEGANKVDVGFTAGVGVDIYQVNLSANYDVGLGKVYKQYPIFNDMKDIRNRVFWIALAYHFQL